MVYQDNYSSRKIEVYFPIFFQCVDVVSFSIMFLHFYCLFMSFSKHKMFNNCIFAQYYWITKFLDICFILSSFLLFQCLLFSQSLNLFTPFSISISFFSFSVSLPAFIGSELLNSSFFFVLDIFL